ncbi:S1 family peptidase [Bdellovibrio sp. HCB290]|uniref:S1 family peptidase n=1 Tax=Bdellovibrio sp. HCB290 TaxID=3394356 RepID=UPI0039B5FBE6
MNSMKKLLVLSISFTLVACGKSAVEQLDTGNTTEIVNGKRVTESTDLSESTVSILLESDDGYSSQCTGTIIGKNLVLTAAHCVSEEKMYLSQNKSHQNGIKSKKGLLGVVTKAVESNEADIAILKFAPYDSSASYKIRALPPQDFVIPKNAKFEFIGYGITGPNKEDSGILRTTSLPTNTLYPSLWIEGNQMVEPGTLIINQTKTGINLGDSGGPLYVRSKSGEVTMVGNISAMRDWLDEDDEFIILLKATDLRTYLPWIKRNIQALQ